MSKRLVPTTPLANAARLLDQSALATAAPAPTFEDDPPPATQPTSGPSGPTSNPLDPTPVREIPSSAPTAPPIRDVAVLLIQGDPSDRLNGPYAPDGHVWARDPLNGADRVILSGRGHDAWAVAEYRAVRRLVWLVRRDPNHVGAMSPAGIRSFFCDMQLRELWRPRVTESLDFEAGAVFDSDDLESLVCIGKHLEAPQITAWTHSHGGECVTVAAGRKLDRQLRRYRKHLLPGTPNDALIELALKTRSGFDVAVEWFEALDVFARGMGGDTTLPGRRALQRSSARVVTCDEGAYSAIDFNEGAPLQQIVVRLDPAIPARPLCPAKRTSPISASRTPSSRRPS